MKNNFKEPEMAVLFFGAESIVTESGVTAATVAEDALKNSNFYTQNNVVDVFVFYQ